MYKFFNKWSLILYYLQRLGKWPKDDLIGGILYTYRNQLFVLLMYLYVLILAFIKGNIYISMIPYMIINYFVTKKIVREYIKKIVEENISSYEASYNKASFIKKVLFFLIGVLIVIMIYAGLIFSFKIFNLSIFQ